MIYWLLLLLALSPFATADEAQDMARNATESGYNSLKKNDLQEALDSFDKAVIYDNTNARAHLGMGLVYFNKHDYKEAIRRFKTALVFNECLVQAWDFLGQSYEDVGSSDQAFETYLKALIVDPLFSKHSTRFKNVVEVVGCSPALIRRQKELAALQEAKSLSGKKIYVENDTTTMDTLILARFLIELKNLKSLVFFASGEKLQPLFRAVMPDLSLVTTEEEVKYDYRMSLSALPLYFKTTLTSIPLSEGYFKASPAPNKKKVGLVWRFDGEDPEAENRVELDQLIKMAPEDSELYMLQEAPRKAPDNIQALGFRGQSLADISTLIGQMDSLIAVDGSIARIAAAMGKKVTIILPNPPQWVWLLQGTTTPWFKNVELKRLDIQIANNQPN